MPCDEPDLDPPTVYKIEDQNQQKVNQVEVSPLLSSQSKLLNEPPTSGLNPLQRKIYIAE